MVTKRSSQMKMIRSNTDRAFYSRGNISDTENSVDTADNVVSSHVSSNEQGLLVTGLLVSDRFDEINVN